MGFMVECESVNSNNLLCKVLWVVLDNVCFIIVRGVK